MTNVTWTGRTVNLLSSYRITTTSPLPAGETGIAYSKTLGATGGVEPYTFGIQSGSLPAGLHLVGATITGTPTAAGGPTSITFRVTDATQAVATKPF